MRSQQTRLNQKVVPFITRWHRGMEHDSPLRLVLEDSKGRPVEEIVLDIRELPNRPDLLARLGPITRSRLLSEAAWEVGV